MNDDLCNKYLFSEISFQVNDKTHDFYSNTINKNAKYENSISSENKYQRPYKIEDILSEIKSIKTITSNYLQNVMERNDKLGALLNKVKDEEEKE